MPYLLISTQNVLEQGPTVCGDAEADPEMMALCDAKLECKMGNTYKEYVSPHSPRKILDLLEHHGYVCVGCGGPGQTCVWTVHKPLAK